MTLAFPPMEGRFSLAQITQCNTVSLYFGANTAPLNLSKLFKLNSITLAVIRNYGFFHFIFLTLQNIANF